MSLVSTRTRYSYREDKAKSKPGYPNPHAPGLKNVIARTSRGRNIPQRGKPHAFCPLGASLMQTRQRGSLGDGNGDRFEQNHFQGRTVLLAEDEPIVREFVHAVLEGMGLTVLAACDGAEALEVAGSYTGHIDLLLTDVNMPRVDGLELGLRLQDLRPH